MLRRRHSLLCSTYRSVIEGKGRYALTHSLSHNLVTRLFHVIRPGFGLLEFCRAFLFGQDGVELGIHEGVEIRVEGDFVARRHLLDVGDDRLELVARDFELGPRQHLLVSRVEQFLGEKNTSTCTSIWENKSMRLKFVFMN